jgi:DNA invertase Pin-like site-specific DNA recombinase
MEMKRVICLYRVSTKKQVDRVVPISRQVTDAVDRFDIPVQRRACHEFIAAKYDWEFYRELSEFGVSGYKISAEKRDTIQEIQQEAIAGKFEVLLVFMFDRLGRIDDETPFVVEWFAKQGIEVWSVKEGEQRFESHVDKLTNYIRFWQASGESEKTSIRTKESLAQMVKEGRFRGGVAPFGYRLEKRGRVNKRGHEVHEIEIDDREAAVVRLIYDLYLTEGYGSQRISTYLTNHGMMNRKGENFTNITIKNMLGNKTYTGILKSGDAESEVFPELQIISPKVFEEAQELMHQRSAAMQKERRVPLNTKGSSLLSGNVFCGHCGARLIVTTNNKRYMRKDGGVTLTPRTRYVCYNKTRHKHLCNGQTGYAINKLDKMIDEIARNLFTQLNAFSKELVVGEHNAEQVAESCRALVRAKAVWQARMAEMREYEAEVLRVIRGESRLGAELLNKLHKEAEEKAVASERYVREAEANLKNSEQMTEMLAEQFDIICSWSDRYDTCDRETRKMMLSKVFKEVRVKRGYEVEIELTDSCKLLGAVFRQLGISE